MLNIADKTDYVDKVYGTQYNSVKNNVLDFVESSGQTPVADTGVADSNIQQVSIAASTYSAGGYFYIDSGIADAYVLGVQTISGTPMRAPVSYFNGMNVRFVAQNSNTTTSTVNVASKGIVTIKKNNWSENLDAGDILAGHLYELVYSTTYLCMNLIKINTDSAPVGSYIDFSGSVAPYGYLECDGSAISRSTYSQLFGVIGENYGVGDGSTTFNIPDWRGYFPRCWDHGSTIDPGAGSISGHTANTNSSTSITNAPNVSGYAGRRYIYADITGTDIPAGTKIVNWIGTTITISKAATGTSAISDLAIDFDVVESRETNTMQGHWHQAYGSGAATPGGINAYDIAAWSGGTKTAIFVPNTSEVTVQQAVTDGAHGTPRVSSETRPENINQMRCIKY